VEQWGKSSQRRSLHLVARALLYLIRGSVQLESLGALVAALGVGDEFVQRRRVEVQVFVSLAVDLDVERVPRQLEGRNELHKDVLSPVPEQHRIPVHVP
jgi:hypothetical protein